MPFPPPGDLPDPGIEPASLLCPALAGWFLTTSATGKACLCLPWPIILLLSSYLTVPRALSKMCSQGLLRWIPLQRTVGACSHFLWRGTHGFPPPFWPQGAFLHVCRQGSLPWSQEWAPYLSTLAELSFCHSFVLGSWVRTMLDFYPTWQTPAVQPRGPSFSYHTTMCWVDVRYWEVLVFGAKDFIFSWRLFFSL